MTFYIDTSAFLAVLDADDDHHEAAKRVWCELLEGGWTPLCNSYVLLETCALLQHRFGLPALRVFHENIFPLLHVEWVDEDLHKRAVEAVLAANRRQLSLTDCTSFATARHLGIKTVFTFDRHFAEQGFTCLPE